MLPMKGGLCMLPMAGGLYILPMAGGLYILPMAGRLYILPMAGGLCMFSHCLSTLSPSSENKTLDNQDIYIQMFVNVLSRSLS